MTYNKWKERKRKFYRRQTVKKITNFSRSSCYISFFIWYNISRPVTRHQTRFVSHTKNKMKINIRTRSKKKQTGTVWVSFYSVVMWQYIGKNKRHKIKIKNKFTERMILLRNFTSLVCSRLPDMLTTPPSNKYIAEILSDINTHTNNNTKNDKSEDKRLSK